MMGAGSEAVVVGIVTDAKEDESDDKAERIGPRDEDTCRSFWVAESLCLRKNVFFLTGVLISMDSGTGDVVLAVLTAKLVGGGTWTGLMKVASVCCCD
jgi:hypothetical protein